MARRVEQSGGNSRRPTRPSPLPLGSWFRANLIALCVLLGTCTPAFTIQIRHDVELEASATLAESFPAVVQIARARGKETLGEGTLVAPLWILTSRAVGGQVLAGDLVLTTTGSYRIGRVHLQFAKKRRPPGPLALLQLMEPISEIDPAQLLTDAPREGEILFLAGVIGSSWFHAKSAVGSFRGATNTIESVSLQSLTCRFDTPDSPDATWFEGVGETINLGGPAFVERNGKHFLAAVRGSGSSRSRRSRVLYGSSDEFWLINRARNWIDRTLNTHTNRKIGRVEDLTLLMVGTGAVTSPSGRVPFEVRLENNTNTAISKMLHDADYFQVWVTDPSGFSRRYWHYVSVSADYSDRTKILEPGQFSSIRIELGLSTGRLFHGPGTYTAEARVPLRSGNSFLVSKPVEIQVRDYTAAERAFLDELGFKHYSPFVGVRELRRSCETLGELDPSKCVNRLQDVIERHADTAFAEALRETLTRDRFLERLSAQMPQKP